MTSPSNDITFRIFLYTPPPLYIMCHSQQQSHAKNMYTANYAAKNTAINVQSQQYSQWIRICILSRLQPTIQPTIQWPRIQPSVRTTHPHLQQPRSYVSGDQPSHQDKKNGWHSREQQADTVFKYCPVHYCIPHNSKHLMPQLEAKYIRMYSHVRKQHSYIYACMQPCSETVLR